MPDEDEMRSRKIDAAFDWLIRIYAPAFLWIANLSEAARELAKLDLIIFAENHNLVEITLDDFRKWAFYSQPRIAVGGLPKDDPVWRKIEALQGPLRVAVKAWGIADTAAAIARSAATNEAERDAIDARIGEAMRRLERNLDELLSTLG